MNQHIIFYRTRYTDKLRDNGVDEKTARARSDALDGALRDAVATKTEVLELENKIDVKFAEQRDLLRENCDELKDETARFRLEMSHRLNELSTRIETMKSDNTMRTFAMLSPLYLGALGLFWQASRSLPPMLAPPQIQRSQTLPMAPTQLPTPQPVK
jgi:hypothetical protein